MGKIEIEKEALEELIFYFLRKNIGNWNVTYLIQKSVDKLDYAHLVKIFKDEEGYNKAIEIFLKCGFGITELLECCQIIFDEYREEDADNE